MSSVMFMGRMAEGEGRKEIFLQNSLYHPPCSPQYAIVSFINLSIIRDFVIHQPEIIEDFSINYVSVQNIQCNIHGENSGEQRKEELLLFPPHIHHIPKRNGTKNLVAHKKENFTLFIL
jgi:hypothetical protein